MNTFTTLNSAVLKELYPLEIDTNSRKKLQSRIWTLYLKIAFKEEIWAVKDVKIKHDIFKAMFSCAAFRKVAAIGITLIKNHSYVSKEYLLFLLDNLMKKMAWYFKIKNAPSFSKPRIVIQ